MSGEVESRGSVVRFVIFVETVLALGYVIIWMSKTTPTHSSTNDTHTESSTSGAAISESASDQVTLNRPGLLNQPHRIRWPAERDSLRYQLANLVVDSEPLCRQTVPVLTPDSLGPLRPGQALRDVEGVCPAVMYGWDWTLEGDEPTPAAIVRFGDAVVEVEFDDTLLSSDVYRISSTSRAVRSSEGFGPGSTLLPMSRAWGAPTFGVNECQLYVWFASRPGLSFRVRVPTTWKCEDVLGVEERTGTRLPDSTTIDRVLLFRRDSTASPSTRPSVSSDAVFSVDEVQEKPERLAGPPPVYPPLLQQVQIEGSVMVEAIIDTLGRVEPTSLKVVQTANPGFNESAKQAILGSTFRPARLNGKAVRVLIHIPIQYSIKR